MFKKVEYRNLNSKQKENYNFHKLAALLADYGYSSMWLNDDWQGADFIANHINGETFLRVQLKGRLTINKKYCEKDIHIAFRDDNDWYIYPHDELMNKLLENSFMAGSVSWEDRGGYSWPSIPNKIKDIISIYKL